MATTAVPYTEGAANSHILQPAGTTLVVAPTNNMKISDAKPEETVLIVSNTDDDTALTFTVKAGVNPPAIAASLGDLAVTVAFGTKQIVGPFESGRFLQADGSMLLESTTVTGTVIALHVPRNA